MKKEEILSIEQSFAVVDIEVWKTEVITRNKELNNLVKEIIDRNKII